MIAPCRVEPPSGYEPPVYYGRRRRPRFGLEAQSGRCPLCDRVMSPIMGRDGPGYRCGCPERPRRSPPPVPRAPAVRPLVCPAPVRCEAEELVGVGG